MQHEVINGRDPICNIRLSTVGTVLYMQHKVTNSRDLIRNMNLQMIGTLYVGWPYVPFSTGQPRFFALVPPSLSLCPGIFNSKFAFVNMSTTQTSHLLY